MNTAGNVDARQLGLLTGGTLGANLSTDPDLGAFGSALSFGFSTRATERPSGAGTLARPATTTSSLQSKPCRNRRSPSWASWLSLSRLGCAGIGSSAHGGARPEARLVAP